MDIDYDSEEEMKKAVERVRDLIGTLPSCHLEEFLAHIKNHYINTKLKIIVYIMSKKRDDPDAVVGTRELIDELDIDTPMVKLVMDDLQQEGVLTVVGDINPSKSIVENIEASIGKIVWV